jgi:hypothetical protein
MVKEHTHRNPTYSKEHGKTLIQKVLEHSISKMVVLNQEYINQDVKDMDKVQINMKMVNHMLVNFLIKKKMERENIFLLMVIIIKGNGKIINNMEQVQSILAMGINMLDSGIKIKNMAIFYSTVRKVRGNKYGKEEFLKVKLSV